MKNETEQIKDQDIITIAKEAGRCAECGELTNRFSTKWDWYICELHNSFAVAMDLYAHVTDPNK